MKMPNTPHVTDGPETPNGGSLHPDCYASRTVTLKDKIRWRLYPANHCDLPEAPSKYKDVLVCHLTCHLSMMDRLRILVSGKLAAEIRTVTENEIGGHITNSVVYALPPKAIDREA